MPSWFVRRREKIWWRISRGRRKSGEEATVAGSILGGRGSVISWSSGLEGGMSGILDNWVLG